MPQEIELVPVKKKEKEIELVPIVRTVTAPSPAQLPEELKPTTFPEKLKRFLRPPRPPKETVMRAVTPEEREREIELVAEEKVMPRYWEKRFAEVELLPSVVPEELKRKKVEKIIDVPGQALTQASNMFLFGIPGFLHEKISGERLPAPKTELGAVAGGLGQLAGMIGPRVAVSPFKVAGRVAKKIFGEPAKTMMGRFIQNTMQSTVTLGLANGAVTWEGEDVETIVANKLDSMASGAATGAVFGAAPWLKLSSNHPMLSNIFRIGMGSAVIDVMHGQTPFDDRSVMQKVYDYGLNIYFLRHGAPELKAKAQVKKLAEEGKAFNRQAEIDGFEVRLPDTVEKIMAELKKEGMELEFIKHKTRVEQKVNWKTPSIILKKKSTTAYMSPDEYIQRIHLENRMTPEKLAIYKERALKSTGKEPLMYPPESESSKTYLRGAFQRGQELEMPWIEYEGKLVYNQEGYHRALIAKERGISEIPVKIYGDIPKGLKTEPSKIIVEPEGSAPLFQPKDTRDPIALQMEENILKLDTAKKEDVRRVQGFYDKSRKEIAAREKKGFSDVINFISTQFVDLTGRTQRMLIKRGGVLGREASIRADLARSSPTVADYEVENWSKRIYQGLTIEQEKILNDAITNRSIISIQKKVRHPGGLKKEQAFEHSKTIPKEIHDRADVFFSAMRRPLVLLKQEGIISQEAFDRLSKRQDYSPRWFIDAVDVPALDTFRRRADINVRDSGLKKLGQGDIGIIEQNSRLFLKQIYDRTWSRVLKNRSNKALLEMAREIPDNGIVKLAGKGRPPLGTETIIAWEDGKPQRMWVPEDMAKSWALSDPQTTQALAHMVQWATGTKILKAFATGYNPAFAITNMPRDLALIWLSTPEYSSLLPKAAFQMGADLIATAGAAFGRKGPYIDYIKEGGGMQFLTKQGQADIVGKKLRPGLLGVRVKGKLRQYQGVLGYVGETSEIWSRLAVRRRSLINGKEPYEATWIARNYLDFNKGGPIIKAVDNGIPYLGASIQATRSIFRAFRDRPAQSTWKVAQVGTLAMGLYYANRFLDPEGWESLSDKTKARYWCLFTPFKYKDKKGHERRLYVKIAKDQGQRVFTAIFEAMAAKSVGDVVDGDYVSGVVRDALPLMPETALPPMLEGLLGYASNKDFWYNDDIWRGADVEAKEEWTYRTSLLAKQFGKVGLSPERAQRALQQVFTTSNFYTDALGFGVRALLGELPEMQKQQTMQQIMLDMPMINRILTSTSPYEFLQSQREKERIRQNTASWVLTREFDRLLEEHLLAKKESDGADEASLQQVQDFLKGKPPQEIQRLLTRWTNTEKLFDTKYKFVWKDMLGMTPESRAKIFYKWWNESSEKQRKGIVKDLAGLTKTGFFSDRFWSEYARLMGEKK